MSAQGVSADPTLTELLSTEFLHCPGCMRGCYTPRLLTCLHSFCTNCVRSAITKVTTHSLDTSNPTAGIEEPHQNQVKPPAQQKLITCPLCKMNTKLPENGGIEGLPVNVFLNNLILLKTYKLGEGKHCDYCCYDNKETKAESLCLECQDVLCSECSAAHHRTKITRSHQVVPFKDIARHQYDHDIRAAQRIKCTEHKGVAVTVFCEDCKTSACGECKDKHVEHSCRSFETVLKQYYSCTRKFANTLHSKLPLVQAWLTYTKAYTNSIEKIKQDNLQHVENHAQSLHKQIESYKTTQLLRITEVCDTEQQSAISKMQKLMCAAQYLKHDHELLKNLLQFGKEDELLSMQHQISLRASQLCYEKLPVISSKLNMQFQGGPLTKEAMETSFGKVSVSYFPLSQPESLALGGNSMSASLMLPNVLGTVQPLGSFVADCGTDSKEVWPSGICLTQDGACVIVDRDNRRIKIFNRTGALQTSFGGERQNELGCPFDAAILKDGTIAVTDYESEDVKIFTQAGQFVRAIRGYFKYPRGVAVTQEGNIAVVDCHFRRVTVHKPDSGVVIQTIEGKDENCCDYFTDPYYITVTPDNKIIVTDWAAPNLRIFSEDGHHLNSYGTYGTRQDQILHPYGVCSDPYGYIFVADNQNHRVHLLLPNGNFSRHVVTKEDGLWHPIGLTTDKYGHLLLTEALGKVKIFKYM